MSPTSSTPKVRSSTAARRTPLRRHHEPGEPAGAGTRRAELVRTLGIVVLAALMGLTSWVVASISTWLVPVYVTAMVLIFVMPQVQHLEEPGPDGEQAEVSTERASESSHPASFGPDSLGASALEADSSPGASASGAKLPGSTVAKRSHTRGRGRKPVRSGSVPIVASIPAAWIRIGPGKFIRADSQDQEYAAAPVSHTGFEATEISIEAAGSPAKLVEETNPIAVSTEVDAPIWVDLNEPGLSPEHESPCEEPVAIANPELDSSSDFLVLRANAARQEFESAAAPATIAINVNSPTDLIVAEPVTEEYGITPSTFGPNQLEASLEDDHEQDWTGLLDSTRMGPKTPADAEDGKKNECGRMRRKPQSSFHTAFGYRPQREMPQHLDSIRSGERRRGFRKLGRVTNCRARAMVQRNVGRSSRAHRDYQPRSPPERS